MVIFAADTGIARRAKNGMRKYIFILALFDRHQPSKHIGFFLARTFASQDIIAITLKPLVGFGLMNESLRIRIGGQRLYDLTSNNMLGIVVGRIFMA
jgi:hypothetical protein